MLRLYYRIWVDCILRAQSQPANKQSWPRITILFMSICMALNLLLIMFFLQKYVFGNFFYTLNLDFLPKRIDYLLNFIILFFVPCIGINYLLIFTNKRYERLLNRYGYHNGRLFITYLVISALLPVILVWLKYFLQ